MNNFLKKRVYIPSGNRWQVYSLTPDFPAVTQTKPHVECIGHNDGYVFQESDEP